VKINKPAPLIGHLFRETVWVLKLDHGPQVIFETYLGRHRRHVKITRDEFRMWIDRIRDDQVLVDSIRRVLNGKERWLDLDEGDAGIFPERIFPYSDEVDDKLEWLDSDKRVVMGTFLFQEMLDEFRE
jgi:hypothetical protein